MIFEHSAILPTKNCRLFQENNLNYLTLVFLFRLTRFKKSPRGPRTGVSGMEILISPYHHAEINK
jgi:hypothetical protein